jgi:uncharacterized protein YndB with AHSA1/START domain
MSAATKAPRAKAKGGDAVTTSGVSKVTTPAEREIRCERIFDAPKDKVWRAYTEKELIAQWWGRGNKLDIVKHEFRKGGHWRFVEHSEGQEHGFEGRFAEITPKARIVQTFEWDGWPGRPILETAEFIDMGDGRTRVISTSLFYTQPDRDGMLNSGMEDGMNQGFAALDKLLKTL